MNMRQKRKHYNYSYRYFVAWWATNDTGFFIPCPKKYKKTLNRKLKINLNYHYDESHLRFYCFDEYSGALPKFMRDNKKGW